MSCKPWFHSADAGVMCELHFWSFHNYTKRKSNKSRQTVHLSWYDVGIHPKHLCFGCWVKLFLNIILYVLRCDNTGSDIIACILTINPSFAVFFFFVFFFFFFFFFYFVVFFSLFCHLFVLFSSVSSIVIICNLTLTQCWEGCFPWLWVFIVISKFKFFKVKIKFYN